MRLKQYAIFAALIVLTTNVFSQNSDFVTVQTLSGDNDKGEYKLQYLQVKDLSNSQTLNDDL